MSESTRPCRVRVFADHAPGPHRTDSDDIWWWLPVLGPTATVLAYLLARHAAYDDTDWDTATLARTVGLGGSCSKLWTSLDRLAAFRVATFVGTDALTVRLYLPALSSRNLASLPDCLAAAYRIHTDHPGVGPPLQAVRRWWVAGGVAALRAGAVTASPVAGRSSPLRCAPGRPLRG